MAVAADGVVRPETVWRLSSSCGKKNHAAQRVFFDALDTAAHLHDGWAQHHINRTQDIAMDKALKWRPLN